MLAALVAVPAADARRVRVFAMEPKLDLAWMESRATYHDKMFALADKRLRGSGRPLIQDGADDFASHLVGPDDAARPVKTARDLVLWPESIGLFGALTGQRAAPARSSGSLEGSIATLLGLYGPQIDYYGQRYPELTGRVPQTRLLALALTDTFGRVVLETFSEMADRYDVYLEAGVDMAQRWQVVCRDKQAFNSARPARLPGGVKCEEQNPQKVAQLGDPFEPERDYVYEATTAKPSPMALLFDPDGKLVDERAKSYLTPTELGQTEEVIGLDLVPGAVSDSDARRVPTSVGTLGFVTSKPAWQPDIPQKLDQQHVDLLVQPELFANDLVMAEGMWAPDTLRASGYNNLLRHPSIEAMVLPELVGNVFNFSADAQSHIAVKPRGRRGPSGYLVGQPPGRGLVQVMPWVVPDPIAADEPFDRRRRRLADAGAKLAPGSGVQCPDPAKPGPCENGHVEGVLSRDLTLVRRPRYRRFRGRRARTRFSRSRPVHRTPDAQRNAAVALRGRRAVIAFEQRRHDRDQLFVRTSRNGGRTWSRRAVHPTGQTPGGTNEWWPSIALGDRGRVTVAWVEQPTGHERIWFARSTDGGRTFGPRTPLDPAPGPTVSQWRPALAQGAGDVVHAAFIDERTRFADGGLPQAGLYYTRIVGGRAEPARRLDTGEPVPLARKFDNSWAPSVAVRGQRVMVAWTDFLRYDWDVFSRLSTNGGGSFGPQADVNDTPADDEALNDSPQAALGATSSFVAWTDWRKRSSTGPRPHPAYDTYLATPGGRNLQVDPYGARQLSTFSPSVCVPRKDNVLVAFQDASRGQNDIRIVRMAAGARRGKARRVDDAGSRGGNAWRPRLACSHGRVLAVWEDERDGPAQIYSAVAGARRLR